eukprot:TRINITY_DN11347_c0_g1_i2.p1 TRINITY_DN11347_c0_g1~~TRINITY_DN11347_c0_g1_i2.p1  ORF type:complete len:111 (-),score=28.27 TRINITY_DN11347_c0_g1_i2:265-564(-)
MDSDTKDPQVQHNNAMKLPSPKESRVYAPVTRVAVITEWSISGIVPLLLGLVAVGFMLSLENISPWIFSLVGMLAMYFQIHIDFYFPFLLTRVYGVGNN